MKIPSRCQVIHNPDLPEPTRCWGEEGHDLPHFRYVNEYVDRLEWGLLSDLDEVGQSDA